MLPERVTEICLICTLTSPRFHGATEDTFGMFFIFAIPYCMAPCHMLVCFQINHIILNTTLFHELMMTMKLSLIYYKCQKVCVIFQTYLEPWYNMEHPQIHYLSMYKIKVVLFVVSMYCTLNLNNAHILSAANFSSKKSGTFRWAKCTLQ